MAYWNAIWGGALTGAMIAVLPGGDDSTGNAPADTSAPRVIHAEANASADVSSTPATQPTNVEDANARMQDDTTGSSSPAQETDVTAVAKQEQSSRSVSSYLGRLWGADSDNSSADGEATRDPFSPSSVMHEQANRGGGGLQFLPGTAEDKVPRLHLRGYVEDAMGTSLALVEVENHDIFLVRQGDDISLQQGTSNLVLRVVSVTHRSVVVEAGTLGHVIVVR